MLVLGISASLRNKRFSYKNELINDLKKIKNLEDLNFFVKNQIKITFSDIEKLNNKKLSFEEKYTELKKYKGNRGLSNSETALVYGLWNALQEKNIKIDYLVGTMIELPRAAIKAKDIAKHAEFFSFGTNDLTQTTFGISRDDSGKFLNDYIDNKIFSIDPFVSIDDGVKDLIEIAVVKGKKQNKKIKLGICGEHGGDPESIYFCSKVGLDYVSCSPYRVPIARLAAAQAELNKRKR